VGFINLFIGYFKKIDMSLNNIPEEVSKKLPNIDQWKKNGSSAVTYVFMILFVIYFIWNQYKDDCGSRIATLEIVLKQKDAMINQLNSRVSLLENALDTKNGVLRRIETKVDSVVVGGAK
jgi:uncharacterized coiled-coil protein SlyX